MLALTDRLHALHSLIGELRLPHPLLWPQRAWITQRPDNLCRPHKPLASHACCVPSAQISLAASVQVPTLADTFRSWWPSPCSFPFLWPVGHCSSSRRIFFLTSSLNLEIQLINQSPKPVHALRANIRCSFLRFLPIFGGT